MTRKAAAAASEERFGDVDDVVDALLDHVTELEKVLNNYVLRYGATELSRPSIAKGRRASAAAMRAMTARNRG